MNKSIIFSLLMASLISNIYAKEEQTSSQIMQSTLDKMNSIVTTKKFLKKDTNNSSKVFDYKLKVTKVSDNVWCFLGALEAPTKENGGNMVNTCYIKTNNSYVLVDSGPSYQYAKQAYNVMKSIEKLPVKIVINTHEHDDHWLGNSFYKENFNTEIIGPKQINDNYKEGDKTRMFNVLPANAIEGTKIIPVDKVPTKLLTLTIGGEKFEIVPIGQKAHTDEDFFVYMPERKVLFTGDLAMNGRITSNRDGSILGEIKALKMMKNKDYKVCIPGHGLNTSKTAMEDSIAYFTLLHKRILKALDDNIELLEITKVITMSEFKNRYMFKDLNGRNVAQAFREMEFLY